MADVQHVEKHAEGGLIIVTKHTVWDSSGWWRNNIFVESDEAQSFLKAFCQYRHELEGGREVFTGPETKCNVAAVATPKHVSELLSVSSLQVSGMDDSTLVDFHQRLDGACVQAAKDCRWKDYDALRSAISAIANFMASKFRDEVLKRG